MTNQRGQASIEFAFIVPFVMFIILGGIYAGILFMDYIQYNNAARAIARDIAIDKSYKTETANATVVNNLKTKYFNPLTSLYTATLEKPVKDEENKQVKVTIILKMPDENRLGLFDYIGFPPKELKHINYVMPIERDLRGDEESEGEN